MKIGDSGNGDPIERLQAGALAHRRPEKKPGCPAEDRLRLLLPGQVGAREAKKLLAHAAECDWCGAVLREAARDLTGPSTGEEEELAGKSPLADPLRRREFAEQLAPLKRERKPPHTVFRWWPAGGLAAGLAAAGLVGGVIYPQWARSPAHTARLLAEAYTKNRQMQMRLAGAQWASERTKLGDGGSSVNKPPELNDAESNIARAMEAHSADPRWLQLQGEADILENKYEPAIDELERAHSLRPNDATILLDWGTALYQEGETEDKPELRSAAFERFSEGCKLKPKDPALLFNRAMAAERGNDYHEAEDDWRAYLEIDSSSAWAREARRHLDEVKKNLSGSPTTPPAPPPTH